MFTALLSSIKDAIQSAPQILPEVDISRKKIKRNLKKIDKYLADISRQLSK